MGTSSFSILHHFFFPSSFSMVLKTRRLAVPQQMTKKKKLTIDGGFHISMTDMLAARINHCGDNMGENCEEPLIMPGGFFSTA